jgi:hypothetical protein
MAVRDEAADGPVAFLFDADHPDAGDLYGYYFDSAFAAALKAVDPEGQTRSRIFRGDVLLDMLCYKLSSIATSPGRDGIRVSSSSLGMTKNPDYGLLAVLIGDLTDACAEQWHTFDLDRFSHLLGHGNVYCLFLPSLPLRLREPVHEHLKARPGYVGAYAPELGNPLQRYLAVESLLRDAFVADGTVSIEEEANDFGEDEDGLGSKRLPPDAFEAACPPLVLSESLRPRGLITRVRLQARSAPDVHQRIAEALLESSSGPLREFEWSLSQLPDAPEQVEVQARKLTDYLLEPDHKHGAAKAAFFEKELGITKADWAFLQSQMIDGLSKASFEDVRLDDHGIRLNATLPVTGRDGRTAVITTAWIVRKGERASLVTAVPGRKDQRPDASDFRSTVLPLDLADSDRWAALYEAADAAGRKAAEACVPTPMKVGGSIYMDGYCGGAYMLLPDGRAKFARWLKANNRGAPHVGRGVRIHAIRTDQSAERAEAYARAFATILRRNGIECSVVSYVD